MCVDFQARIGCKGHLYSIHKVWLWRLSMEGNCFLWYMAVSSKPCMSEWRMNFKMCEQLLKMLAAVNQRFWNFNNKYCYLMKNSFRIKSKISASSSSSSSSKDFQHPLQFKHNLPCWHMASTHWGQVLQELHLLNKMKSCSVTFQNESYWAVHSCGAVYYAVQGGSNFWVCRWNPKVWPFKWKLLSSTFLWCCLLCCTRWS